MRTSIFIAICWLMPLSALAQKVVVLPVSYWLVWEDAASVEKAQAVMDEVGLAVSEAGYEVVRGDPVASAAASASGAKAADCRDSVCLSKVAAQFAAENALFISITEEGLMYNVEIILAKGEPEVGPLGGNFAKLLTGVVSMVKTVLLPASKSADETVPKEPEPVEYVPVEPKAAQETETATAAEETEDTGEKSLDPIPFYAVAGVTGALVLSWVIVESIGYSKLDKLESGEWSEDDAKKLQTADRVLLGLAVAGAIATTVLGVLTDFSGNQEEQAVAKLPVPTVIENGGMLVIEGRF